MTYTDVSMSNSDLLPIEWSAEVIKNMAEQSAALALSRRRTMSTRQSRMPATTALAGAYWVGNASNDFTDLKQTTKAEWKGVTLNVEELAVLVPIPHAYLDDNLFPVWEETQPQISEAMGAALDAAVFFGINKPSTWPSALYPTIVASGQTVEEGTQEDLAADIAESARVLKSRGFRTTGFAVEPGFNWRLISMRSADGIPIYTQQLQGTPMAGLYGFPMPEVANGAWEAADPGDTPLVIHGDWSKSIVGIRQDITFTKHDSGVISDETGAVIYNSMQQDSTIWRAVFRVAWARANPATRIGPAPSEDGAAHPADEDNPVKFPWAAITPSSAA